MSPRSIRNEKVPAELLRSAPRAVRLKAGGIALAITAGVMFASAWVAGVWLYLAATRETRQATAEVQEVSVSSGENPRWVVRYRYTVDGREYSGRGRMGRVQRQRVEVGSVIPIRYSVTDAARSWIGSREGIPIWLPPLVAVNLAAGAAGIAFVLRREAALLIHGRPALGRVIDAKRINQGGGHGAKTQYRLTVEYRLMSGALQTARFDRRQEIAVGSSVIVVYDRDNSRRSQLYPFPLVRTQNISTP
jgi:hypothetical protein